MAEALRVGGHINLFVVCGGTSFGFDAGANVSDDGELEPDVTSYDYDALLREDGELTLKYHLCREAIFAGTPRLNDTLTTPS